MTCTSRKYAWPKKNNFSKFSWHDTFTSEECQHYNGYLGASEKILSKRVLVRPQYRGAHYYLVIIHHKNHTLMLFTYPRDHLSTARARKVGSILLEAASTRYGTFRDIRYQYTSTRDQRGERHKLTLCCPPNTATEKVTFLLIRGRG